MTIRQRIRAICLHSTYVLAILAALSFAPVRGQEQLFVDFSGLPITIVTVPIPGSPEGFQFSNPAASAFELTRVRVVMGIDGGGAGNLRIVQFTTALGAAPTAGNVLATIPVVLPDLAGLPTFAANAIDILVPAGVTVVPGGVYGIVVDSPGQNELALDLAGTSAAVFQVATGATPVYLATTPPDGPFQLFGILPGGVVVILVPVVSPLAATANQRAIASALDSSYATGSADLRSVITTIALLGPAAGAALDSLGPEAYTFADEIALSLSTELTGLVSSHLFGVPGSAPAGPGAGLTLDLDGPRFPSRGLDLLADGGGIEPDGGTAAGPESELPEGWRVAARGIGSWLDRNGTSTELGFDSTSAGTLLTLDRTWGVVEDDFYSDFFTLGVAAAYATTEVDFDRSRGETEIEGFHVGPYLGFRMGGFHTGLQFLYGHNWYDTERRIAFPGVSRTADSDHEGNQYTSRFEFGHTWHAESWSVTPEASLEHVHLDQDGFTESGAGALNLRVSDRDYDSVRSGLGLRWQGRYDVGGPRLAPLASGAWLHEFGDDDSEASARFAGTAARFTVRGADDNRDRARFGTGLRLEWGDTIAGLLDYHTEFDGDDLDAHSLSGGVEFRFR